MNGLNDIDGVQRVLAKVFVVVAVLGWLLTAAAFVTEVTG